MAELARTPPALRRLFRLVDLTPQPISRRVAESLTVWRRCRAAMIAPDARDLALVEPEAVRESSFVAQDCGGSDFELTDIGRQARRLLAIGEADRLSGARERRLAAGLRRLLRLAREAGEPVLVRFGSRRQGSACDVEAWAGPARLETGELAVFCTLVVHDDAGGLARNQPPPPVR